MKFIDEVEKLRMEGESGKELTPAMIRERMEKSIGPGRSKSFYKGK
jgi:hypothetical protein